MPQKAINFGLLLIVLGLIAFGITYFSQNVVAFTSLIPAYFGVVLLLLGFLGLNHAWRKHVMHLAAMLALVGFLLPGFMTMKTLLHWFQGQAPARPLALATQAAMAVVCVWFLVLCIQSFRAARRQPATPGI